ncbi:MAG: ribosome biogenesis GTPase YlqF [Erysipelotrichaceae bacterium]|jgi:ribosome biogenesis GTPase A|nr:ribosome biogenesis GTPase YlqF [Erysipelotrichaceae bacterium]
MSIQWFPGHMTKALRQMREVLNQVDLILELRDARAIASSGNPLLIELKSNKPSAVLITKKDLADPEETSRWLASFDCPVLALDLKKDSLEPAVSELCSKAMQPVLERWQRRGIKPRDFRAMVVGIPNVGKSTFLNRMSQKKSAGVADQPGLTRSLYQIKAKSGLLLVDSPGVLPQKFEDPLAGMHLALIGSIEQKVLPMDEILDYGFAVLKKDSERFMKAYGFYEESLDLFLKKLQTKKGLSSLEDTKWSLLRDIQTGRLGRISWERYADRV